MAADDAYEPVCDGYEWRGASANDHGVPYRCTLRIGHTGSCSGSLVGPAEADPKADAYEQTKFQAETITTAFLADRLRRRKHLCDRCEQRPGTGVLVGAGSLREWLCGPCLGDPEPAGPLHFGGGTLTWPKETPDEP